MKKKLIILSLALCSIGAFIPSRTWAQGCIISRECAPEFGLNGSPFLMPSQWQFDGSFRYLDANKHYNGTNYQIQRDTLGTFVMNRQRIFDLGATYGVSEQFSANITIPYLVAGEWGLPVPPAKAATATAPATANGPRANFYTSGLGDISINGRYWILNTKENMTGNIQVSAGIKIPTGNDNVKGNFPNISTGKIISYVSADQSIQPGDGGWGIPLEIDAFKTIDKFTGFMTAEYLINPRDTNNTPSILLSLGITPSLNQLYEAHNTVQDQYLFKIGVAYQLTESISISIAGRIEGVPVRDLIGRSDGFRRPGDASFIESGIIWNTPSFGSFSASVPVTITRDRAPDAFGNPGDATFANYIVLVGYSYRL